MSSEGFRFVVSEWFKTISAVQTFIVSQTSCLSRQGSEFAHLVKMIREFCSCSCLMRKNTFIFIQNVFWESELYLCNHKSIDIQAGQSLKVKGGGLSLSSNPECVTNNLLGKHMPFFCHMTSSGLFKTANIEHSLITLLLSLTLLDWFERAARFIKQIFARSPSGPL